MIEEKLEIVLITYNRSKDLENTFKQLLKSPFSKCKITILDNHSNDETSAVCAEYQKLFPSLGIIRHKKNIGANPNILRAIETSKSLYTWILCDDDNYDFSDCLDVIDTINSKKFDLISLGAPGQFDWERGLSTTSTELIEKGSRYYVVFSFIPSFIFKTKLFDSRCIHMGYFNVANLYPHFEFINKSVEDNFSVYISKNEIIIQGQNNPAGFTGLQHLLAWTKSCSTIKNKKIRRKSIYDSPKTIYNTQRDIALPKRLFEIIMTEKIQTNGIYKNVFSLIGSFMFAFGFSKDLVLIPFVLFLALFPLFLFRLITNSYIFFKYKIRGEEVPKALKETTSQKELDFLRH